MWAAFKNWLMDEISNNDVYANAVYLLISIAILGKWRSKKLNKTKQMNLWRTNNNLGCLWTQAGPDLFCWINQGLNIQ